MRQMLGFFVWVQWVQLGTVGTVEFAKLVGSVNFPRGGVRGEFYIFFKGSGEWSLGARKVLSRRGDPERSEGREVRV